jgi:ABC-2 type transport system ATP-binding protein
MENAINSSAEPLASVAVLSDGPEEPAKLAEPVIHLDGLSVQFGKRPILKELRGELRGRAIGLLGPNGAGKTTLIHTLLGFHPPSSGTAHIFGRDIRKDAKPIRTQIGYMPERDSFIANMTCVHFVRLMAELSGLPSEAALERAHEALFYVGLGEARYRQLGTYSLGMKQLAKLAQAIVHGPRLIFLDEPTNGLDPPARQRMIELVRQIRDSGKAHILLSSHLLRDVEECCEEILIIKDGRIAVYCNLEEERRANRKFLELETRGDREAFVEAIGTLGCEYALTSERRLKLVLQNDVDIRHLYQLAGEHKVQIRRLNFKRDSLEDIFLKAMEGGNGDGARVAGLPGNVAQLAALREGEK